MVDVFKMAAASSSITDERELTQLLLLDIENNIPISIDSCSNLNAALISVDDVSLLNDSCKDLPWGKSLFEMPLFGVKDIEKHRINSGKTPGTAIIKTLERGKKFKEERYVSADSIFTCCDIENFNVKALCKASMKKDKRSVFVQLDKTAGDIKRAKCSCPAGKSGYCNHVMALLFELADYSLNQLKHIPDEISCTSRLRQWGIPGETCIKAPVMKTTIQKEPSKRGISSTLFSPRKIEDSTVKMNRITVLQEKLKNIDPLIGFASSIPPPSETRNTPYGKFDLASPLSYHLNQIPFHLNVVSNLESISDPRFCGEDFVKLPLRLISADSNVVPSDWNITSTEKIYLKSITVSGMSCRDLEYDTVKRYNSKLWLYSQKRKILSTKAHKVFIRKKNFESLTPLFLEPNNKQPASFLQEWNKHQRNYEAIARDLYGKYLLYELNHDTDVRATGCVIQPSLSWIVSLPDGLVSDRSRSDDTCHGVVKIKCLYRKRNSNATELMSDPTFFATSVNGKIVLKKDHPDGYFTEAQIEMGLVGASYCDFIAYTFHSLIVVRVEFDGTFFTEVIKKLNYFYKNFLLPKIITLPLSEDEEL